MSLSPLQKRCVDLSYRHRLAHLSSVLDSVDVIDDIYQQRQPHDPFVLGNSHASLGLFVALEKHGLCDAEEMLKRHGTHANRDMQYGVWVSGGSLGQAETVAVGLALSNPHARVWVVTSDGACMEGCVAEASRIAAERVTNLHMTVICNGRGAYRSIREMDVSAMLNGFFQSAFVGTSVKIHRADQSRYPAWLCGIQGHYLTLTNEQHQELMA